jgi:hypothetical protein
MFRFALNRDRWSSGALRVITWFRVGIMPISRRSIRYCSVARIFPQHEALQRLMRC